MLEKDAAPFIPGLSDPDPLIREDSATAIFRRGSELVAPLLRDWLANAKVAQEILAKEKRPRLTVGVAVMPARFDGIRVACGWPRLADVPPDQDAKEFELDFDGGIRLDILTSSNADGPGAIARYLQKFGEGIQQIEIDVSNVDRATEILRSHFAVQPVYPAARAGANKTRVNFFLVLVPVPSGAKVLIELVQPRFEE